MALGSGAVPEFTRKSAASVASPDYATFRGRDQVGCWSSLSREAARTADLIIAFLAPFLGALEAKNARNLKLLGVKDASESLLHAVCDEIPSGSSGSRVNS